MLDQCRYGRCFVTICKDINITFSIYSSYIVIVMYEFSWKLLIVIIFFHHFTTIAFLNRFRVRIFGNVLFVYNFLNDAIFRWFNHICIFITLEEYVVYTMCLLHSWTVGWVIMYFIESPVYTFTLYQYIHCAKLKNIYNTWL